MKRITSQLLSTAGCSERKNRNATKLAESRECDLAEVYFYDADTSYAGVSYVGAIGSIFGSSRMCASAVLIPKENNGQGGLYNE